MMMPEKRPLYPHAVDHTGKTYGYLTALYPARRKGGQAAWAWRCECGVVKAVVTSIVVRGKIASCGCMTHIHADPYESMKEAKQRFQGVIEARSTKRSRFTRNVGFHLAQLRKLKGWNQSEMARRIGGPKTWVDIISRMERGHIQMVKNLVPMCRVLQIPLWELIRRVEEGGEYRDERIALWVAGG